MTSPAVVKKDIFISVCTPAFNGEEYLEECLDSILVQTHVDQATWEYILFLDADDFLDNQALEFLERELDSNHTLKLVYSGRYHFGAIEIIGNLGFDSIDFSWIPEVFDIDRLHQFNCIPIPLHHARFHDQSKTVRIEYYSERFKVLAKHGMFEIDFSTNATLLPIEANAANTPPSQRYLSSLFIWIQRTLHC